MDSILLGSTALKTYVHNHYTQLPPFHQEFQNNYYRRCCKIIKDILYRIQQEETYNIQDI